LVLSDAEGAFNHFLSKSFAAEVIDQLDCGEYRGVLFPALGSGLYLKGCDLGSNFAA
jgi:hypothetical protein